MNDNRKVAIYSRKSKFTGKGESIGNQIELCKQSIHLSYPDLSDDDILIFEDEGFSGGNTNRPQFQEMLKQCRQRQIRCIVCYRLDRISRNVGDFSSLIDELNRLDITFNSISEKFDTTSHMGRAMMYIASVFAQLERETIAERIRDNMLELAKDGRWLGGNPPTGYKSVETVGSVTIDGKKRKARKLEVISEESEIVKLIYAKFLEFNSLTKTETYLIQNNCLTKTGKYFSRFAIKNILTNPVYLIADEIAWNYFEIKEVDIFSEQSEFNGQYGIMAYNKTSQQVGRANEIRDMKEWIIAVGKHKGIVNGHDWVEVQKLLEQNKSKSYRKPKSNVALLSGLIFCGKCGGYMRPKLSQRKNKDGELIYDYLCELKEKSKSQKCDMKRSNGNELDKLVCEEIKKLTEDKSAFTTMLKKEQKSLNINDASYQEKLKSLRKSKSDNEAKIKSLVLSLTQSENTPAHSYILQEINELDEKTKALQTQIKEYEDLAKTSVMSDTEFEGLADMLLSFAKSFDGMSIEQKRSAIRAFIRKIVWDGENVHIYFFGSDAMDFTAYNSFICEKVKQITEEYLKEDIANKISNTFEKIFMQKRESIKLSEIFKSYREWLIGDLEEDERYELNNEFYASMEDDKDYWLECSVSKEKPTNSSIYPVNRKDIYTCDFGFRVHKKYNENGVGYIGLVYFEGSSVKDVLKITSYNKFQSLLLNLYYNKTPVILDIEDESNIDTSLGLDI